MGETLSADICVIGAGTAGVAAAVAAARQGVPVVLVEQGELEDFGHHNDVAAQALGTVSRRMADFGNGKFFGLKAARPKVDYYRLHDRIREVVTARIRDTSFERLTGLGIQVALGIASFTDGKTLRVGDKNVRARWFIIAPGSVQSIPFNELLREDYYTTSDILERLTPPKNLVVVGATPMGLVLAQAYRRLGAAVTVLDTAQPLVGFDEECAAIVLRQLEREGVILRTGACISQVKRTPAKIQIFIEGGETIEPGTLVFAAQGVPDMTELNLAAVGVAPGPDGIAVDKYFRTRNKSVYAIGDATGKTVAPHVARRQAELVVRQIVQKQSFRWNESELPRFAFTDPEIAQIGLTEAEARNGRRPFRVLRWPYHENARARAEGATAGHVKVIASPKGEILGVTIVGAQAGELIAAWTLALGAGMNISALAELATPSPSFVEIGKQAAVSYFAPGLAPSRFRRIMTALRLRG